jgi:tetratricopeptide (TPR) repeat protein
LLKTRLCRNIKSDNERGAWIVIGKIGLCVWLLIGATTVATGQRLQEKVDKCKSTDPDTSITWCTEIIQERLFTMFLPNERVATLYFNRGNAYRRKGNYDPAISDLDEAARLNPKDADVYWVRGSAYLGKNDYDHAIQDLSLAIRLGSRRPGTFYDRGRAFNSKGDYDHAIQDFSEAIRLSPKDAGAYFFRGLAYFGKDDYDHALEDINQALSLTPNNALALYSRGVIYADKGNLDKAILDYNEAIRVAPKFALAYNRRGDAYLERSNLNAAIADFEQAISSAPSSNGAVMAALMLHVILKRQGRDDTQELARVAAAADLSKWPGPMLKLALGQTTADEVLKAALTQGSFVEKWHVCDANYFTGEDALFHHQRAAAITRLRAARDGCPKGAAAYRAAIAELKRLDATANAGK